MKISIFLMSFFLSTASLFAQAKKNDPPVFKLSDGYFYAVGFRPIHLNVENARYSLGRADHFYLFLDLIPIDEKKHCPPKTCELTVELTHWTEGKEISSQLKHMTVEMKSSHASLTIPAGIRSELAINDSSLVIRIIKGGAEYFRLDIPVLFE